MLKTRATLPIAALRGEILQLLKENNVLVVCGETGSGKTTQVKIRFRFDLMPTNFSVFILPLVIVECVFRVLAQLI